MAPHHPAKKEKQKGIDGWFSNIHFNSFYKNEMETNVQRGEQSKSSDFC